MGEFASTRNAPKKKKKKKTHPVLSVCGGARKPFWEVFVTWWQPRTPCTATAPKGIPRANSRSTSIVGGVTGTNSHLRQRRHDSHHHSSLTWNSDNVLWLRPETFTLLGEKSSTQKLAAGSEGDAVGDWLIPWFLGWFSCPWYHMIYQKCGDTRATLEEL